MIADAIVQEGGPDVDIKRNIDCRYRKWTIFKLIVHLLYTPLYTSIIKKYFTTEFYYVDLFAGSGFGYLSEEDISDADIKGIQNVRIAGSPLIASSIVKEYFTRLYLNDVDQAKIKLLKKRIEILAKLSKSPRKYPFPLPQSPLDLDRIKICDMDANEAVKKIMKEIEEKYERMVNKGKGCHVYFFIDPEGLEFKRESLERIVGSDVQSDIMTLFNSYGAALQAYNHIHHGYSDSALRECVGNDYAAWIGDCARMCDRKLKELSVKGLADSLNYYQAYLGVSMK
ncbi:MAG: three-Cys-motif partner protein TcmP [Candidatus Nezhaarchaeales archaeon]